MASHIQWQMRGSGYEFCNCDFGCGCNFGGFPNSKDGSCRALVGLVIARGKCGDVDLAGVKCAAIVEWPKAIHEGNGKAVFVVDPATTDKQIEQLAQIFTGKLGGMPWELLGPTFEVVVSGARDASDTRAMLDAVDRAFVPNKVVVLRPADDPKAVVAVVPYARDQVPVDGAATAYVCRNFACDLPTTKPEEVRVKLGADVP